MFDDLKAYLEKTVKNVKIEKPAQIEPVKNSYNNFLKSVQNMIPSKKQRIPFLVDPGRPNNQATVDISNSISQSRRPFVVY